METASKCKLHPIIKWAQRKDKLFLELQLRDVKDEKVDLTATGIGFTGESGGQLYEFQVEFFDEVAPEVAAFRNLGFQVDQARLRREFRIGEKAQEQTVLGSPNQEPGKVPVHPVRLEQVDRLGRGGGGGPQRTRRAQQPAHEQYRSYRT